MPYRKQPSKESISFPASKPKPTLTEEEEAMNEEEEEMQATNLTAEEIEQSRLEADKDKDDVPVRAQEKKRLDWTGKTYLVRFPYSSSPFSFAFGA